MSRFATIVVAAGIGDRGRAAVMTRSKVRLDVASGREPHAPARGACLLAEKWHDALTRYTKRRAP